MSFVDTHHSKTLRLVPRHKTIAQLIHNNRRVSAMLIHASSSCNENKQKKNTKPKHELNHHVTKRYQNPHKVQKRTIHPAASSAFVQAHSGHHSLQSHNLLSQFRNSRLQICVPSLHKPCLFPISLILSLLPQPTSAGATSISSGPGSSNLRACLTSIKPRASTSPLPPLIPICCCSRSSRCSCSCGRRGCGRRGRWGCRGRRGRCIFHTYSLHFIM